MSTLILTDLILFFYIYIGMQWFSWSLEQTLSSKTGFVLLILSSVTIARVAFKRTLGLGKIVIIAGIVILLIGFALSLQVRSSQSFTLLEGASVTNSDQVINLKQVVSHDDPGLIRNDVLAKINVFNKFDESFKSDNRVIKIMPNRYSDGYFWRISRFGFAPVLYSKQWQETDRPIALMPESWTNQSEALLAETGLIRNPPPRMMLGVGAFPPEMETLVNVGPNEYMFLRLSSAKIGGKTVSLEGDNYWRYLTRGRLKNTILKISVIKNNEIIKKTDLKIGQTFSWGNDGFKYKQLKYWVELERRYDPFMFMIIAGLLITYLGVGVYLIQQIIRVIHNVFKNTA